MDDFHSRGKSELVLDVNMDQYQCIRVLENKMLPFSRRDIQANVVQHTERDASWISSKMRMCSTLTCYFTGFEPD